MKIGALVLAGGQSRRFGSDKRQATLPNGKLVIQQTLEKVTAVFDDILLVLRKEDADLRQNLESLFPDITYYHAPDSELGMGHSLANGVSQVDGWDGVFVFLADMPFVEVDTLRALISSAGRSPERRDSSTSVGMTPVTSSRLEIAEQLERRDLSASPSSMATVEMTDKIIVPSYQNKPGHPVGFGSDFFGELGQINGDRGARVVINNHQDAIVVVPVEDQGVLSDIDQSSDLN